LTFSSPICTSFSSSSSSTSKTCSLIPPAHVRYLTAHERLSELANFKTAWECKNRKFNILDQ
jgi:hypothetical protein